MGREFLSEIARRKAKEIQCIRQDEREMREETRQDDSRKESGNRKDETSTKKGVTKSHPFYFERLKYLCGYGIISKNSDIEMFFNYIRTVWRDYRCLNFYER